MVDLDLRTLRVADVYKGGRIAATLDRSGDSTVFAYLPTYVADGGPAVSSTLPLVAEPVVTPPGAMPPFFAGLLPEGRRLTAIRTLVKTSPDDEFSLLLAVGQDTVGDVQVVPAGSDVAADPSPPPTSVSRWKEAVFSDLLAQAVGSDPDRTAIAGVQDKISGRMISFPLSDAAGDWILKLDPPEFPHLVQNEAFFLEKATVAGIHTVAAKVVQDATGADGLKIERFDRQGMHRQAVEDGCQALGLYPADKYRTSTEELIGGLAALCSAPAVAAYEMFRMWVFAYLTGNGDLHAKNLSVVWDPDGRVSPAYDVPSTFFYGDTTMALSVGGSISISKNGINALTEILGIRQAAASRVLSEVSESVRTWIDDIDDLPFTDQQLTKFQRVVRLRLRSTETGS